MQLGVSGQARADPVLLQGVAGSMAAELRVQELRSQQARWLRERQAELDRERVVSEMQAQSSKAESRCDS
jgi:hypothetical protein